MEGGTIAGISIGIIFFVLLVIVAILFGVRTYSKKKGKHDPDDYEEVDRRVKAIYNRNWFMNWLDPGCLRCEYTE